MAGWPSWDQDFAFLRALAVVRRWEGGWSNHAGDPGGLTRMGVTLKLLKALVLDFNGDGRIDGADLAAMTGHDAARLYHRRFWRAAGCHRLPAGIALAAFDGAVNQGVGRAARLLQKALGVTVDGAIGPRSEAAARAADPRALLRDFMARRALHYSSLAILVTFGLGWFRRLFDVHREALAEIDADYARRTAEGSWDQSPAPDVAGPTSRSPAS